MTNNNGVWIGFLGTSITITINYNSLHSLQDYECLLFCCGRLGSDLRMGHYELLRTNELSNLGLSLML
jgi:hypothetical protein